MLICTQMPQRAAAVMIEEASLGLRAGLGDPAPMREHPAHGDLELNFVYRGNLGYFVGGRFVDVGAGALAVFWGALPHQIVESEPDTEFMYLRVPLSALLRFNLSSGFLRKVLG